MQRTHSLTLRGFSLVVVFSEKTNFFCFGQVLDWAGLVLNAHYTQLVITPEAHELLVSCHKTVSQQVRDYQTASILVTEVLSRHARPFVTAASSC